MNNFTKKLGLLTDVRSVPDPLGCGVTFHIRSKRHPAYKAIAAELAAKNPIGRALQAELSREQSRAAIAGRKVDKEAAVNRVFDKLDENAFDSREFIADNIRRVATLLDGWEGEDTPFTLEAAIELLSLETPLDPALPYATKTVEPDEPGGETTTLHRNLGEALMAFIEEQADEEAAFLEGVEKNSAPSAAGAADSSAD